MDRNNVLSIRDYKLRMHEKKVDAHAKLVKAGYASVESLFAMMREVNHFFLPQESHEQNRHSVL